jgi:DNA-binding MarR family transcriptional regulator
MSSSAETSAGRASEQAVNLLGALSLAVSDRMGQAVTARVGSVSDAAALSALHHFLTAPTIDLLAQALGLTSSGTVRLVDRLEAEGLVRRGAVGRGATSSGDARATTVALTSTGRRRARQITEARRDLLSGALGVLDEGERRRFGELAGRILAGMVRPPGATRWTCRLCDTTACGRPRGECPAAAEAERRYGRGSG